jgi:hypothetical protein
VPRTSPRERSATTLVQHTRGRDLPPNRPSLGLLGSYAAIAGCLLFVEAKYQHVDARSLRVNGPQPNVNGEDFRLMSGVSFELQRGASGGRGPHGQTYVWPEHVDGLGAVELAFPTEHSDYPSEYCEVTSSGERMPLVTYLGLTYLRRPLLARGELRVNWEPVDLSRNAWCPGRKGRALRIRAKGRDYTYTQRGGKRGHELVRPGASVYMRRSSWRLPRTISGTCSGETDSVDIGIALVMEGVYTRNLSVPGTLVSLPGRLLNRFSDIN